MFLSLLDLLQQQGGWPPLPSPSLPAPEWREEGGALVLRLHLPGIDPRSVQVQVAESRLTLAGQQTHEERVEGQNFRRYSASYGAISRSVGLPARVVPRETRTAWLPGEILEIRLRKA